MPLLVPTAGTRTSSWGGQWALNLLTRPAVLQYSTANQTQPAAPETAPSGRPRKRAEDRIPSGLHAHGHAVTPCGTSRSRTSATASDAAAQNARSSQDGNRGFFQNRPPADGPRRSQTPSGSAPDAAVPALDIGKTAGDDAPCPARCLDTVGQPLGVTKGVPHSRRPRYSTETGDAGERTTARTPSTGKSAHDNAPGLAVANISNHAGHGPRER